MTTASQPQDIRKATYQPQNTLTARSQVTQIIVTNHTVPTATATQGEDSISVPANTTGGTILGAEANQPVQTTGKALTTMWAPKVENATNTHPSLPLMAKGLTGLDNTDNN